MLAVTPSSSQINSKDLAETTPRNRSLKKQHETTISMPSSPQTSAVSTPEPLTFSGRMIQEKPDLSPLKKHYSPVNETQGHHSPDTSPGATLDTSTKEADEDDCDLESWAGQIRAELRYIEILELAAEAERAAEAGEEHFVGQPSTFIGRDDALLEVQPSTRRHNNTINKRLQARKPSLRLRSRAYSEVPRGRRSASSSTKLGVLALRPAVDVFPNFASFHNHLRTHLTRSNVDEKTLVYDPQPDLQIWPSSNNKQLTRKKQAKNLVYDGIDAFSQSFSFERWVPGSMSSDGDELDYGDVVAEHLSDIKSSKKKGYKRIPKIDSLPGLNLPHELLAHDLHRLKTVEEPPNWSPPHSPERGSDALSPQALFDQADDEGSTDSESQVSDEEAEETECPPSPPQPVASIGRHDTIDSVFVDSNNMPNADEPYFSDNSPGNNSMRDTYSIGSNSLREAHTPEKLIRRRPSSPSGPTFVTPARLRVIRDTAVRGQHSPDEVESLLLSSSTQAQMLAEASTRDGEKEQAQKESILIPDTLKNTEDRPLHAINLGFKPRLSSRSDKTYSLSPEELEATFTAPAPLLASASSRLPPKPSSKSCKHTFTNIPTGSLGKRTKTRKVKVLVYGPNPSGASSVASDTNSILQHSQLISVKEDMSENDLMEASASMDYSLLSLSAADSPKNMKGSLKELLEDRLVDTSLVQPPHPIRRSASTGALLELDTDGIHDHWNPFSQKVLQSNTKAKGYEAALRMFSQFSRGQSSLRTLQFPPSENDDFLQNYLYCSKVADANTTLELEPATCHEATGACADVNSCLCASLFQDSGIGHLFRGGRHGKASDTRIISLDQGVSSAGKVEPESWLDLANEQIDGVITQLVGQSPRRQNPWNISFDAPILKKSNAPSQLRERLTSIVDSGDEGNSDMREEKKSDASFANQHQPSDSDFMPSISPRVPSEIYHDDDTLAFPRMESHPVQALSDSPHTSSRLQTPRSLNTKKYNADQRSELLSITVNTTL